MYTIQLNVFNKIGTYNSMPSVLEQHKLSFYFV